MSIGTSCSYIIWVAFLSHLSHSYTAQYCFRCGLCKIKSATEKCLEAITFRSISLITSTGCLCRAEDDFHLFMFPWTSNISISHKMWKRWAFSFNPCALLTEEPPGAEGIIPCSSWASLVVRMENDVIIDEETTITFLFLNSKFWHLAFHHNYIRSKPIKKTIQNIGGRVDIFKYFLFSFRIYLLRWHNPAILRILWPEMYRNSLQRDFTFSLVFRYVCYL